MKRIIDKKANNSDPSYRKATLQFIQKKWFIFFAVLFYVSFAVFYMGPALTHCTDSVNGFGDSTAGPIWRNSLQPKQPLLGGNEKSTNFPKGETLYTPVSYASVSQTTAMSLASEVTGPVCAYNLSNLIGYLTTALVMFALILYLTKSRWIALLSGYAVAFTPYIQSKIGGHPSYAYGSLLIALFWLMLHIIKTRRKKHAVFLAVILGICAYFDPYFILLAGSIIVPMLSVWAIYSGVLMFRDHANKKDIYATVKVLAIALGLFLLLVSPLAFIRIKDAKTITSSVGAVRGNVTVAAIQCSNKPIDYLLPDPKNVYMLKLFGSSYTARNISHRNWCGYGESRVALSLTMITVTVLGIIIIAWEGINRRRTRLGELLSYNPKLVLWSIGSVALAASLIGLPPRLGGVITPSGLILKVTETWRIFAREYLVVNLALVVFFAIILKYFSSIRAAKQHRNITAIVFVALFLFIMGEYQINQPFNPPLFTYSKDVPQVYYQIKNNKSINAIAEYPIDRSGIEHDSIVYYLTMQTIHQKKLFNSAAITDSSENIHIAMKDLTDPQTLPALRYLGINYVVIHGSTEKEILAKTNQLSFLGDTNPPIYNLTFVRSGYATTDTVLAKIANGPKTDRILTFQKGFVINLDIMNSPINTEYETLQDTELKVTPLNGNVRGGTQTMCFDAKMSAIGDAGDLTLSVNGVPQSTTPVTDAYSTIRVTAKEGDTILLHNSKGYNMRLNNLGCSTE